MDLAKYSRITGMSVALGGTFLHFQDPETAEAKRLLKRTHSCPSIQVTKQCSPETFDMGYAKAAPEEDAASTAVTSTPGSVDLLPMIASPLAPMEEDIFTSATAMSK